MPRYDILTLALALALALALINCIHKIKYQNHVILDCQHCSCFSLCCQCFPVDSIIVYSPSGEINILAQFVAYDFDSGCVALNS